jgi:hypothetical protein
LAETVTQLCALSSSGGNSRWRERMRRSVVQNATRRARLCATSNRLNGSRVQTSPSEWLTRVSRERSSTTNRLSLDSVLMNWGLVTESRPTSARNWISRKETGEMPHGRYRSNQGKLARRFDSRTIQIRKWVSRSTVTTGAAKRGVLDRAIPKTTDRPHLPAGPSGLSCNLENAWHSWYRLALPDGVRFARPCARLQLLPHEGHHQASETNVSWLQMPSCFSYVQCTRNYAMRSRRLATKNKVLKAKRSTRGPRGGNKVCLVSWF